MSEQTPNSSEDLSGAEPSMEDILASIRKIISDDEPVAMESPEDIPVVSLVETDPSDPLDDLMQGIHMDSNDLTSDAVLDAAVVQPDLASSEGESVDLNIDDVLAGLDEDILGSDVAETSLEDVNLDVAKSVEPQAVDFDAQDDVFDALDVDSILAAPEVVESSTDVQGLDDDILALLDDDIPLATGSAGIAEPENSAASDDVEMDALLDDILMVPLDVEDDVQDTSVAAEVSTEPQAVEEQSDLDLVKSLMADLADDQGEVESDEDLDALLAIPEVEEETPDPVSAEMETAEVDEEDDILGDILNMTLEDELQTHPDENVAEQDEGLESLDAVIDAEQENVTENADILNDADDDLPSLSEIAAAAEADAAAVETDTQKMAMAPQAVAATAGLGAVAGLAALGATTLGETPAEAETETAETYSEPSIEPIPTQETSMPVKAVKTDAILDDVTEAATAGAFAELNQVVEDKAIFNERGPRIGDLVQEALRPMLKEWLDANLKGIVERAVTKEVKRISSGK